MSSLLRSSMDWLQGSWWGQIMREVPWLFPTFEALHFVGMALLFGTIALLDFRVLGFAKGLSLGPLHRLLPLGLAGFAINVITGVGFVASDPYAYVVVPAFRFKLLLILLAGLNAVWFWISVLPRLDRSAGDADTSRLAKISSIGSLMIWIAVVTAGRFIAFSGTGTL